MQDAMAEGHWLSGIAQLGAQRELLRVMQDRKLLLKAIIREIRAINDGLGYQAVSIA